MTDSQLPTDFWVRAQIRQCSSTGTAIALVRRGEFFRGAVLLKLNRLEMGCAVLSQARDERGRLAWLPALGGKLVSDGEADAYIARSVARDPDLWVVEVEDREGRNPFEGKIL